MNNNTELNNNTEMNYLIELKLFIGFFIESLLVLIVIQLVSDKPINIGKECTISFLLAIIIYIARLINEEMRANILQGLHYGISTVFLSHYLANYT
jgi:hypothetical protein